MLFRSNIDYTVGIILNKKVADKVKNGETLGYIHANNLDKLNIAMEKMQKIIVIEDAKIDKIKTIFGICN